MEKPKPVAERTATDDRIDANREPAPIAPATRDPEQAESGGLPPGMVDSTRSPLDPVFSDRPASDRP
jgi:hypothetical protein